VVFHKIAFSVRPIHTIGILLLVMRGRVRSDQGEKEELNGRKGKWNGKVWNGTRKKADVINEGEGGLRIH